MNRIRTTLRKIAVAGVLGAALPLLVAAPASADQETKLPHGYTPAHADGWYSPDGGTSTVGTADTSIRPVDSLRRGYAPAHADGWFAPGSEVTVQVAGEVLSRATNLAPRNVR